MKCLMSVDPNETQFSIYSHAISRNVLVYVAWLAICLYTKSFILGKFRVESCQQARLERALSQRVQQINQTQGQCYSGAIKSRTLPSDYRPCPGMSTLEEIHLLTEACPAPLGGDNP